MGRTYHHGDLRETLLASAREIVEREGVEAFTLRDGARRAGVSHGAPAHHFGNKTGLLTEVAVRSFEERLALVEHRMSAAGRDPFARLKACGLAHIEFILAHPKLHDLCSRADVVDRSDPAIQAVLQRMSASLIEALSAVTGTELEPDKEANPAALLAMSVVNGFAGLVNERILLRDVPAGDRVRRAHVLAEQMLELLRDTFRRPHDPG